MKTKGIINSVSVCAILLSSISFAASEQAKPIIKPIDPTGWDEMFSEGRKHLVLRNYLNPFTESKMYQQRDFFAQPNIAN